MAYTAMPDFDTYRQAIRSSVAIHYSVNATLGAEMILTDLRPTGGSITDTTKPGVRRVLTLELAADSNSYAQELFDALSPIGTTLTVTAHVRLTNRSTVQIPMGVFDVDSETLAAEDGTVSLTAPDKWVRIQRARFVGPAAAYKGVSVQTQLRNMIRDATSPTEPVNIIATRNAAMKPIVWEKDRDKAMIDLAKTIGAWVYFDRNGVATIADVPTIGASADWLVDASASGVLTELDRERSRRDTYNVVVVTSSATDGEKFPLQYVYDSDPSSPTFAGTGVPFPVGTGPFGIVPMYYDTPILTTASAARAAGRTILSRVMGLASSVSLGQVPNPAVDAFDVLDVLPPNPGLTVIEGYAGGDGFGTVELGEYPFGEGVQGTPMLKRLARGAVIERHVADTITHPLTLGQAQTIEGRSTRFEEIEGAS